jgi:outer membrane protein assembly factor BamA
MAGLRRVSQQASKVAMCRKSAHALLFASLGLFGSGIRATNESVVATTPEGQRTASCPIEGSASFHPSVQDTIAELPFEGQLQIPATDQESIASSLRQQTYSGDLDTATSELQKRVILAWQERGFFKPRVEVDAKVLTSSPVNQRLSVTVHVDAGKRYRLGDISFINNRAVVNPKALRNLFPINQGDLFKIGKVREGMEKMRYVYGELGYINATFVSDMRVDEERQEISVTIDTDEGKSFVISSINFVGLDDGTVQNISSGLYLKRGDIYNQRLASIFMQENGSLLPGNVSPDSRIRLSRDNGLATVGLTFDFRECR